MKLLILSGSGRFYSTRRLVQAARARRHTVQVLDPLRCSLRVAPDALAIHYQGRSLHGMDAVIPRIGVQATEYGCTVLRQLEILGVYTPNDSASIRRARNKLGALQCLAAAGLAMPLTVYGDHPDDTRDLLAMLGPPPHIIKLNQGSQGRGVVLADNAVASQSVIEAFRGLAAPFLAQQYIREAEGRDLRCLVVGNQVVAAIEREARPGEFRANLHRGGRAQPVELTAGERRIAIQATQVLGLEIAGVDLLRSRHGPLLLEVNASPGLEGIENCTGVPVAEAIIDWIEQRQAAPDRQATARGLA